MNTDRKTKIESPAGALAAMCAAVKPVLETEAVDLAAGCGRVLAADVLTDRPSPATHVSSMDGFAIRVGDFGKRLPVAGVAAAGKAPLTLKAGAAIKIFTGACLPFGAEAVVKREEAVEADGFVTFAGPAAKGGQFIRWQGENAVAGAVVAKAGSLLTPATVSAMAANGAARLSVIRRLRVEIMTTGDELVPQGEPIKPHQIRDANGPALAAMLSGLPWVEVRSAVAVQDKLFCVTETLQDCLRWADVVLLTGGVSMGDLDFVPAAVADVGGPTVFHKLPTRPGKPLFAATTKYGQAIIGLPGNPVSVLTTARWFALAVLRHMAGLPAERVPRVRVTNVDEQVIPLHWFRLVRLRPDGTAELLDNRGSGDVIAAAGSDGFVHVEPGRKAEGELAFYAWGG